MEIIVQKYGGSSVADTTRIKSVAKRIKEKVNTGEAVVVVVSAMGDSTDKLLGLAHSVAKNPDARELDLLLSTGEMISCSLIAMALQEIDIDAISMDGAQAGIRTDEAFGEASIISLDPSHILKQLASGKVVIVAGFQGVTEDLSTTTLGRGASDLTAVALAASLKATCCEVYTDVEGIYTADPRMVTNASKISEIGYEEMLELASYGAKMQPRSIELAARYNVPVLVASSTSNAEGTLIHDLSFKNKKGDQMEVRNKVSGVASEKGIARITVRSVPDTPGVAASIFEPLSQAGISVDTIVQNASAERLTDLSFTVSQDDTSNAISIVQKIAKSIGAVEVASDENLGNVSIVGTGMQNGTGFASTMFLALKNADVNIEMITTSQIRITCIVDESRVEDAVIALHDAFELDKG